MGKGTDKLYITHSEWSSADAYSASVGANAGARAAKGNGAGGASFKRLPFNFCAASLQPFKNPVCTPDGTIFDVEVISAWLDKHATNPVNGQPLAAKDLIKLNFARNADTTRTTDKTGIPSDGKGDYIDPVSFKVFTDNTHIVAVRHGTYANVFAWDTVERMNIKAKMWRDLVDDAEFGRKDIITLQDPQNAGSRDLSQFKFIQDGQEAILTPDQEAERKEGSVNIAALGRIGEKVLRAKEAVERARQQRESGGDVNRTNKALAKPSSASLIHASLIQEKKLAHNAATYTTGKAAASFTSTGLTPSTSGERALLSDEEWMLRPKRVKIHGYARIETTLGDLTLELLPEFAPKAVWNFTRLAQRGKYRSVPFHRSIKNFMIQGGDPTGTGRGGTSIWGTNFADELEGPLTHDARGVVSMANKGKNTNSSQFFITYRAAKHLDRKHTIFAKVIEGLDTTLAKMEAAPTGEGNRPLEEILIKDVVVYVDPFEEFLKEKSKKDSEEQAKADIARQGGTEDDEVTWTGKRIRTGPESDGEGGSSAGSVGKYLKGASAGAIGGGSVDTWEEQPRKKVKTGGFGNFDGW
ncbi:putative cyclophilin type peptidyl-prolyl cis-trans isomerase [Podospora aff. communis PSN243]|uniref:Peptidyl-prolyl cis-trans isomerase-like 2 n=1 Tax=Podospora aff. communis PSN243 TaxID=3040156 RepID=A0AAV9H5N0_9PEZI|nr:putative cyclophilin type peptidyl-prolyl cis-trans isomerase [Podospora aff. communis PSN243]